MSAHLENAPGRNRLEGKVALVSGGGSIGPGWGNGKTAAVVYAREGARVAVTDWRLEAAEETANIIKAKGGEDITKVVLAQFKWALAKP